MSDNKYAGFFIRFLAFIIDFSVITGIAYLIWGNDVVNTSGGKFEVQFNGIQTLLPSAYYFLSWYLFSSTLGKLVFGLKIVDSEGNNLNIVQSALRIVGYIFLIIGWIPIIFSAKKRALHDFIAGTYVVKK